MSQKPDWRIAALNKETEDSGNIGVAWNNPENDTITISFNPFVTIPNGKQFVITMFRNKKGNDQ